MIPALILIVIAWPVTKTVIAQKDTSAPDLTIKVTGYRWKWGYDYLKGEGEGISFVSTLSTPREQIEGKAPKGENCLLEVDNEVVVPVGKKVRVIATAADVIHATSGSATRSAPSKDAIGLPARHGSAPSRPAPSAASAPSCAARSAAFMPIVVRVVSPEDYSKWWARRSRRCRPPRTIRPSSGT